ncbi:MAG: hypothetical protein ACKVP0_17320 [Pirellulaceae bacterium]
MTTEQLKNAHDAKPFRPFTIHLADGTSLEVPHPELLWRTPSGRTIFVSRGGEDVAIVDLLLVTQLTIHNGRAGAKRKT